MIMYVCKILSVNTLLVLCNATFAKEDPIVETKYGIVKGKTVYSRSGMPFYAFQGIPYAKPPVGNLRFKAPTEPSKWRHILITQENAQHCLQKNYLFSNPKVIGSEDCLYLNVYTPKLRAGWQNPIKRFLPVMVFIHWGGFFTGFSSSDYLGPEYIMDKNVILVTFNYRLGILGFFSTNDDASPGNYGLKDQVAALRWVKDNIEYFGGNSNKVTIFGQSAGGASVNFHMFSPESKDLFHQGISQSGTSLALWAKPQSTQLRLAQTQATFVGCQELENTTALIECLRTKNAEKLVESGDKFKFFSIDPLNVYLPSIEQKTANNPNPFITKQPIEYIRNKEFNKVPWIIGGVTDEGLIRAEAILRQSTTRKALNKDFNTLMPELIALSMSTSNVSRIWTKIKDYYFKGMQEINITDQYNMKAFIDLYSDRSFSYSTYQAALFHNLKGHQDIWFYNFNYTGQYSYGDEFAATNEEVNYDWGVSHCDDLLYLFNSSALFPQVENNNDKIMIETMTDLWTNFAIYGNPTPENRVSSVTLHWQKLNHFRKKTVEKEIFYMNINGSYKDSNPPTLSMKKGFYKERFKFWEDIPLVENIEELDQVHIEM